MRRHVTTCTFIAAAALTMGFVAAPPGSASPGPQHIPNSSPGWMAHAKKVGTPSPSAPVSARVYLAPRGGLTSLTSAARAVSTPGSADYGKFLTAAQYHAQFDPSAQTVSAVRSWLQSSGFKIDGQGANGSYFDVRGTVVAAQQAFSTTMGIYTHNGMTVQAPNGALSTPDSLAGTVLAVSGLDTTPQVSAPQTQNPSPPSSGYRNSKVCSQWYGGPTEAPSTVASLPTFNGQSVPYSVCGYTGPQLRGAYEGSTPLDGTGVTVAIVDAYASGTIESDANSYAKLVGVPQFTTGQFTQSWPGSFTQVNSNNSPKQCGASGWYGEETLDVEAVHSMAPGANIRYYAAASCNDTDLLNAFSRINNEDVAKVVSNSWGGVGDVVKSSLLGAYEQAFLQGAVEGISYLFSSGDGGDEATALGSAQTDYPASDPYVTAVGGTSTEITQSGIQAETGWQTSKYALNSTQDGWSLVTSFLYGGGGGYSSNIKEPDYQIAAGIQSPNGGRAVPDVAMDADPTTGMLIGQTQTFPDGVYFDTYRIGGTSLACPLFAGMTALKIQASGKGLGLLNPLIYKDHSGFSDVTGAGMDPGSVRVDYANGVDSSGGLLYTLRTFNGATTTQKVGPGWDTETGWGTARVGWLTPAP